MSEENTTNPEILHEEYIPIEVVPPPDPVPPGDGFVFGVVVEPPPPTTPATSAALVEVTTLYVDVFLVGAEGGLPTVTQLDDAGIKTYFEYLDRTIRFVNPHTKEGVGRVANTSPAASLLLVVTNRELNTASGGVVNVSG